MNGVSWGVWGEEEGGGYLNYVAGFWNPFLGSLK